MFLCINFVQQLKSRSEAFLFFACGKKKFFVCYNIHSGQMSRTIVIQQRGVRKCSVGLMEEIHDVGPEDVFPPFRHFIAGMNQVFVFLGEHNSHAGLRYY